MTLILLAWASSGRPCCQVTTPRVGGSIRSHDQATLDLVALQIVHLINRVDCNCARVGRRARTTVHHIHVKQSISHGLRQRATWATHTQQERKREPRTLTWTRKILVWLSRSSFRRSKYHVLRSAERGICFCVNRGEWNASRTEEHVSLRTIHLGQRKTSYTAAHVGGTQASKNRCQ